MIEKNTLQSEIIIIVVSAIQYLLGGIDTLLKVLCIMMFLDIITGLCKAFVGASEKSKRGYLDSAVMWQGGIKKILTLVVVCVATIISYLITPDTMLVRTAAVYYYVATEAISVLENVTACGLNPPKFLKEIIEKIEKENDNATISKEK